MNLLRLRIERLPGIWSTYQIEPKSSEFHVIFGPNKIGKSSICRAVEGLLWPERGVTERTSTDADFEINGEVWRAEREGGRVKWTADGEEQRPPAMPPTHHRDYFFLRLPDLVDPSPDGTKDAALEIRKQLAGGLDLQKIASDFSNGIGAQPGRSEYREYSAAQTAVERSEGDQANLERRAEKLGELESELAQTEHFIARKPAVERALELEGRLAELAELSEEIAAMPGALSSLVGDEFEQIQKLKDEQRELETQSALNKGHLDEAQQKAEGTNLQVILDARDIAKWREHVEQLASVERDLIAERKILVGAQEKLRAETVSIGQTKEGEQAEVILTPEQRQKLIGFFRNSSQLMTEIQAVSERIRLLERLEQPDDASDQHKSFEEAADSLRHWLQAPEEETKFGRIKSRAFWVVIALVIAAVGVLSAVLVDPQFVAVGAFGLGIVLAAILLPAARRSSMSRSDAKERFLATGQDAPEVWDWVAVKHLLEGIEEELAEIAAKIQRQRYRSVERESLENELDGLADRKAALDVERQNILDIMNLATFADDAELFDMVVALDRYAVAKSEVVRAKAQVELLETKFEDQLSEISTFLEKYGEPEAPDLATAKAGMASLEIRNNELKEAKAVERTANQALSQISESSDRISQDLANIYTKAELDPDAEADLKHLLDLLPIFQEKRVEATKLENQIAADRDALNRMDEAELGTWARSKLEQVEGQLESSDGRAQGLRNEIAEIKAKVDQVREGWALQDLIGDLDERRLALEQKLDETLFVEAGQFLINQVEEEYEQTQMPQVFEKARALFAEFTRHGYQLQLRDGELTAKDLENNEEQKLDQLSDGTRAQLLLATRLAFAEEVEQGKVMPLFLDEALEQSDPERYRIIIKSLGRLSMDQGRQIFYMTSDPGDVGRIQHALNEEGCPAPETIDLGEVRNNASSVGDAQYLYVAAEKNIPEPGDADPEAYGVSLGVPIFDPVRGPFAQHVYYILRDDLTMLHDFLKLGIGRTGQWETVAGTALASRFAGRKVPPNEISERIELLQTFCALWQQGRGRPIDREVIENTGAVSDRFLDDVSEIASELSGDAERFLATLQDREDPRLSGFRKNKVDEIEQYLRANDYLDDQPVLTKDELTLRALASPAAAVLPEGAAETLLSTWWQLAEKQKQLN